VLAARAAKDDPMAWLKMEDIYGDVGRSEVFRERFASVLRAIWLQVVEIVITNHLKGMP
jgi:mannitol 2-dehydrogenase